MNERDSHETAWQLELSKRSFKKREKIRLLERWLGQLHGDETCLDLGCAKGTLSYFLRQCGGRWVSADLDWDNVRSTMTLVHEKVVQIDSLSLPFRENTFDIVVSMDFLEHVEKDSECLDAMCSLVKPGGRILIGTPATGRGYWLNKIKPRLGLTLDLYGHVREGYSMGTLVHALRDRGFVIDHKATYARFLTEAMELFLNVVYLRKRGKAIRRIDRRDGIIAPGTAEEFQTVSGLFKIYSRVYPLLWAFTRLDFFLKPVRGYALILAARRTPMEADK